MGSRWRVPVEGLRSRLRRADGGRISGVLTTIVGTGEGGALRISGFSYTATPGHLHSLDGQSVGFGEQGISRDQVPSAWRELLDDVGETFSFEQPSERWSWVYRRRDTHDGPGRP
jgi:hypothetical protein